MTGDIRPIKDRGHLETFAAAFQWCWACGVPAGAFVTDPDYPRNLQIHHCIKFGRSDERANLIRLCRLCHDVLEHSRVRWKGSLIPSLSLAEVLWLKRYRDPNFYQRNRLAVLRQQALPRILMPGGWYRDQFSIWQPHRSYDAIGGATPASLR